MEMRSLGATGERVSALCMGCWEIGGQAWGDFPAWDGVRLVRQAFDAGITTFDTAEVYGNGRSEVLLGEALYGRRDDAFIISKVGYLPGTDGAQSIQGAKQPRDYSPKRIRDACDLALRRLRTDYIDAYLLHDPPLHIVKHEAPFAVLQELQAAGKIRWWGISARTGEPEAAVEAIRRWNAPVVETPYNAVDDGAGDELLPLAAEHGTGVFARSPFANGLILLSEQELAALPASDWRQSAMFRERLVGCRRPARAHSGHCRRARRTGARHGYPLRAGPPGRLDLHRRTVQRRRHRGQHPDRRAALSEPRRNCCHPREVGPE